MQQFKIGDYVILQNENIYRILNVSTTGNNIFLDTNEYPASDNWWSTSSCKLWQPEEGEWCWFSYRTRNLHLAKFVALENERYNAIPALEEFPLAYSCCEPFIGELPSFLKG